MKSQIAGDICPECGSPAYIGMNNVECTLTTCRHFDESTKVEYLLEQYGKEEGQEGKLTLPQTFDDIDWCTPSYIVFDWRNHVKNNAPMNPLDTDNWDYDLPPGAHSSVNLGDILTDNYDRDFEVCTIDRAKDVITIRSLTKDP